MKFEEKNLLIIENKKILSSSKNHVSFVVYRVWRIQSKHGTYANQMGRMVSRFFIIEVFWS